MDGVGSNPTVEKAGSLPPVKARRRQNAIDNLNAVSKAASRSGARRDGRSQRDFVSLKKSARHLLVRTPLLTQLRIAETNYIKADVRTAGTLNTDCMQADHHARSTGCRL